MSKPKKPAKKAPAKAPAKARALAPEQQPAGQAMALDVAPGEPHDNIVSETVAYAIGLAFALILTGVSFWVASTSALWGPGVAVGLVVLAIAQMGVHLVFFLHITSGPDNTNNVLALAFGVLIVFLVMVGTIWIMAHLSANMGPTPEMMNLMTQRG